MPDHPRTPTPRTLGESVVQQWMATRPAGPAGQPDGPARPPLTTMPGTPTVAEVGTVSGPVTCCRSRAADAHLAALGDPADAIHQGPAGTPTTLPIALDDGATLPTRATAGDAGLDLWPLANTLPRLMPNETRVFDTGVHVAIPSGYYGKIEGRSGLASRGVTPGGGVIDSSYRGSIGVVLTNHGQAQWVAEPGKAIAQLVLIPCLSLTPVVVDDLGDTARGSGGFGSSDGK